MTVTAWVLERDERSEALSVRDERMRPGIVEIT